MANSVLFKKPRGKREAYLQNDFSKGMMFTSAPLELGYAKTLVNYDISANNSTLVPRCGVRTTDLLVPDMANEYEDSYHSDDDITIMAAQECVEPDGNTYRQLILGKVTDGNVGELHVVTSPYEDLIAEIETREGNLADDYEIDLYNMYKPSDSCPALFSVPTQAEIHKIKLTNNRKVASVVGSFAFTNSFYFVNPTQKKINKTVFDAEDKRYVVESVDPVQLTPTEAVTYGYNMLLGENAYNFVNNAHAGAIELTGILPYSGPTSTTLVMTPKPETPVTLRCFFNAEVNGKYRFTWEWRNVTDEDWTLLSKSVDKETDYIIVRKEEGSDEVILLDSEGTEYPYLQWEGFTAPTSDIMIRVQAYNIEEGVNEAGTFNDVEQAMIVGLNFAQGANSNSNLQPETYDLTTATGMTYWKNRLVLWGVPKDPTILFLSNVNEPACFSYPNDIDIFDEPIVYAVPFLDTLLVFTTSKVVQLTLSEDGNSWNSQVIQAHLNISPWDKHLIQTVKNMIFFKSGNYYFMIVPKAQSLTGELALAPVSNALVDFFNHFNKNVEELLFDVYAYEGAFELVNYYNFLDYDDMHNVYVFEFDESSYLHLDVMYNTNERTWRLYTYEAPQMLYPYKQDATQTGQLASTSIARSDYGPARIVQLYAFNKNIVKDFYIPSYLYLHYSNDELDEEQLITDVSIFMEQDDTIMTFDNWQFLDTGYVADEVHYYKRYRELQLMLNNLDGASLYYGMDFIIDGQKRVAYTQYETEQVLDEHNPNYGLMYLQPVQVMNLPVEGIEASNETILGYGNNVWTLDQSLFPEIAIWRIRTPISGKGAAPRLRLLSKNNSRFELSSVNWIYRYMNMR